MKTFLELLDHAKSLYGERDAFRIRTKSAYRSVSYKRFYDDVMNLAAALVERGLGGVHLAVVGENSYQWVVSYLATVVTGGVIVPIDKELTGAQMGDLVRQSGSRALFCSDDYIEVADELRSQIDIPYFAINCAGQSSQGEGGYLYVTLDALIAQGEAAGSAVTNASAGDNCSGAWCAEAALSDQAIASIVYTSGTTGASKGVMLSRGNLFANVLSADIFIKLGDTTLSVLPMHHTYEFTLDILFGIYQGRTIAINNGIKHFAQNLKMFAPTDMLVVPLVAESLYNTVWQNVRNSGKESALRMLIKVSGVLRKVGIDLRPQFFRPIHAAFGGRLKALFVGGAYLDPAIAQGFDDLGIEINIGYGITECSPLVTGNITHRSCYTASCGVAIPGVEVKVEAGAANSGASIDSTGKSSAGVDYTGEGEILVRGASVMMGYYNDPQSTMAVLNDGWFRTGDIGRIDKQGMLFITGRVKNMIVLKNGKNVYPEELEGVIGKLELVKEVVVSATENSAGEELAIVAQVYLDPEKTEVFAGDPQVEVQTQIQGINHSLPYYKRVVSVVFRDTEFPKTTTKKIKRY